MKYKSISFIVPAYNEEKTIREALRKLIALDVNLEKEILVIDDGSKDKTAKIVREMARENISVKLISHKQNAGKGAALRTGFDLASGDIVAIQDADLEYNVDDFKKLIKPIASGKFKVVYGSRFLKKNQKGYGMFYFGNKFLSLLTSVIYFVKITDMETCYKVFDKSVAKSLKIESRGFGVEPEITAKVIRGKNKILELPIDYFPRTKNEGKKIRISDGIVAVWTLLRYRFS